MYVSQTAVGAARHMDDLPAPLVGAEVDLRDFPFTPIYRARLFGSAFHSMVTDAEWRAGVTLWLKSWDQVPTGTLPSDAVQLCRLAELGRDLKTWQKIAGGALHGWFHASDGRLHHRVVAEGVQKAWKEKCDRRDRTDKARAARLSQRLSQTENDIEKPSVTDNATEDVTGSKRREGKRREEERKKDSEADASGADAPAEGDGVKDLWDRGLRILGQGQRSLLGKLRKTYTDPVVLAGIVACETELPSEPAAFLIACCEQAKQRGLNGRKSAHVAEIEAFDYITRGS